MLLVAALFSAIGLLVTVQSTDAQAQTSAPTRQVWAWGLNDHGQLGDGTTTNRLTPIEVSGLSDVQAIAAADGYHSLAISGAPAQDTTPPTLLLPADITEEALDATGTTVTYTVTATDDVDGSLPTNSINCSSASGSLFPIGTTQVNCSAADVAGNQASGSFQVNVVYAFGSGSGGTFGEPVRSTELNQLAAGAGVPVRFGLGADYGLNIFAEGYPTSKKISCTTLLPTYPVEETATVTKSGLTYDAASGLYTYVWKTDRGRGRAPAGNSTLS